MKTSFTLFHKATDIFLYFNMNFSNERSTAFYGSKLNMKFEEFHW